MVVGSDRRGGNCWNLASTKRNTSMERSEEEKNYCVVSAKIVVNGSFPKISGCADLETTRYALGAVAVYPAGNGTLLLAAADSRILGTVLVEGECQLGEGHKCGLIPLSVLPMNDSERKNSVITCQNDKWRIECRKKKGRNGKEELTVRESESVEGRFPDLRHVLPDSDRSYAEITLDPNYLHRLMEGMQFESESPSVTLHIPVEGSDYFDRLVDSKDILPEMEDAWATLKQKGHSFWFRGHIGGGEEHGIEKIELFRLAYKIVGDGVEFRGGFFIDQNHADASLLGEWEYHVDVNNYKMAYVMEGASDSSDESLRDECHCQLESWASFVAKRVNKQVVAGAFMQELPVIVSVSANSGLHFGLAMPMAGQVSGDRVTRNLKEIRAIIDKNLEAVAEPKPEPEPEVEVEPEPEPKVEVEPKPEPEVEPEPEQISEIMRMLRENQELIDSLKEKISFA